MNNPFSFDHTTMEGHIKMTLGVCNYAVKDILDRYRDPNHELTPFQKETKEVEDLLERLTKEQQNDTTSNT